MKNLKRFLKFILRFKSYIIFAFIFMSLSVLLSLPMSLLTKYLIDSVIETKKKAISLTSFILLMDGPTSQFDLITERVILEFLKEYKNEKNNNSCDA